MCEEGKSHVKCSYKNNNNDNNNPKRHKKTFVGEKINKKPHKTGLARMWECNGQHVPVVGHPGGQTIHTYSHYTHTYPAISLQGTKHKKFSNRLIRGHAWGCLLLYLFFGASGRRRWKIISMSTRGRISRYK